MCSILPHFVFRKKKLCLAIFFGVVILIVFIVILSEIGVFSGSNTEVIEKTKVRDARLPYVVFCTNMYCTCVALC
jgi:hypothetical protein